MVIPFYPFFLKEVKVLSSCCYNKEDFREVMELISQGKIRRTNLLLMLCSLCQTNSRDMRKW